MITGRAATPASARTPSPGGADGYTIPLTTNGASSSRCYRRQAATIPKDFAPVTLVARSPVLAVAGPKVPMSSIADLVARQTRARQNHLRVPGVGARRILPPNCQQAAGFDMLMIPTPAPGTSMSDAAGDIDIALGALSPLRDPAAKDVKASR
jgi:tripartite-type tricarboxylate transporter receptor subunit TctC